ncbi:hypothetical protein B0T10DRAFT_250471 [Thelonectria olida]|uniref:Uncharacterized protein n=1 Tax=Thelonectria olida TaxID=1576542 RepID=A0A9P8W9Z3_9HYPO|nr:hypothetical protein B0T10DRAFT_250471 [Thelonectria olida]
MLPCKTGMVCSPIALHSCLYLGAVLLVCSQLPDTILQHSSNETLRGDDDSPHPLSGQQCRMHEGSCSPYRCRREEIGQAVRRIRQTPRLSTNSPAACAPPSALCLWPCP